MPRIGSRIKFGRAVVLAGVFGLGGLVARAELTDVLKPGGEKPAKAVVLYDGSNMDQWEMRGSHKPCEWKPVPNDKAMQSVGGDIETKEKFKDYKLHLEWKEPFSAPNLTGQQRGNSGVYQQSRYELQVLDNHGKEKPDEHDCGSIYGQSAPLKNACKPQLEWQAYDVTFRAARYKDGKKVEDARITVYQNGELIQDNTDIKGPTGAGDAEADTAGPIRLQYHNNDVQYRNIWIAPVEEAEKK